MSEPESWTEMSPDADADWEAMAAHARERCKEQGLVLTKLRATVLRTLWESGAPQGAYALTRLLNVDLPKPLATNSVYRALFLLERLGLVRRIASQQTFRAVSANETRDDVLLLCESCGDCTSAGHGGIGEDLLEVASAHEFAPSIRFVEVVGTCGPCARGTQASHRRIGDAIRLLVPTFFLQPVITAGLEIFA